MNTKIKTFHAVWNTMIKYKVYIQIAISLVIITLIFQRIDGKIAFSLITQLDFTVIGLLLALSLTKFVIQAINWHFCLNLNGNGVSSLKLALKTHIISSALRFFLPGGLATFGKVFYINTQSKTDTVFSILIEKFYITWGIVMFASISLPLCLFYLHNKNAFSLFLLPAIVFILPFFILKIFPKMTTATQKKNYNKTTPIFIATQLIFIPLTMVQYYILLQFFLSNELPFFMVAIVISLILSADIIPITYSGLGLRETASMILLPLIGIPAEIAVGTSLIIFLFNAVIPAIPGVVLIAINKPKEQAQWISP